MMDLIQSCLARKGFANKDDSVAKRCHLQHLLYLGHGAWFLFWKKYKRHWKYGKLWSNNSFANVYLWLEIVGTLQVHLLANFGCDRVRSEGSCVQFFFILRYDYEKTPSEDTLGKFDLFSFSVVQFCVSFSLFVSFWEELCSVSVCCHRDMILRKPFVKFCLSFSHSL